MSLSVVVEDENCVQVSSGGGASRALVYDYFPSADELSRLCWKCYGETGAYAVCCKIN